MARRALLALPLMRDNDLAVDGGELAAIGHRDAPRVVVEEVGSWWRASLYSANTE
jgi:hypothetical protein